MQLARCGCYYNERVLEGSTGSDSGAQIRDGIKTVVREGFCPEAEWPYDTDAFATKPSAMRAADFWTLRKVTV